MRVRCKERVHHSGMFQSSSCSRTARRDGYCTQHHPDSVAKRRRKAAKRYQDERDRKARHLETMQKGHVEALVTRILALSEAKGLDPATVSAIVLEIRTNGR